ncbi:hypothetical protein D3C72_244920 [compost metagenome]
MKWTLIRCTGYTRTFELEGSSTEITVFAKSSEEAKEKLLEVVREGSEVDIDEGDNE